MTYAVVPTFFIVKKFNKTENFNGKFKTSINKSKIIIGERKEVRSRQDDERERGKNGDVKFIFYFF